MLEVVKRHDVLPSSTPTVSATVCPKGIVAYGLRSYLVVVASSGKSNLVGRQDSGAARLHSKSAGNIL